MIRNILINHILTRCPFNIVVRAQFPQKRTWTGNTTKIDVPKKTNTRTTNRRRVNKTDNVQHAKDCEVDCSKTAIDTKKGSKMLKRQENEIVGINTTCTTSKGLFICSSLYK